MKAIEMHRPLTHRMRADGEAVSLPEYRRSGGYDGLQRALREHTPASVVDVVKASNLRGRGGGGFPAGVKWASMPDPNDDSRRPRYVLANADEMEPGAFKDRVLMEADPHQLLEGLLIAGYACQADEGVIFLREEYSKAARVLTLAIAEAAEAGLLGDDILGSGFRFHIQLHISGGRYLCGESSALLNAMEGRRVIPRPKPPRAPQAGLWGLPTIVNNVETLCNVPGILRHGAAWFQELSVAEPGRHGKDGGTKLYGASGAVVRPGCWELPMGTTAGEILERHAGGLPQGRRLRGLLPGGASTGFLVADQLDLPMDFDTIQAHHSRLGTGTMIVLDDATCPVGFLHNLERFFARESCGWCTPCREGLPWTEELLADLEAGRGEAEDIEQLRAHTDLLWMGKTFCAHAPGAMMPLKSALHHFPEVFDAHVRHGACPWAGEGGP